jgi:hypothetical protein
MLFRDFKRVAIVFAIRHRRVSKLFACNLQSFITSIYAQNIHSARFGQVIGTVTDSAGGV